MSITAIAQDFVALQNAGKAHEAEDKYWSDDVVSIENMDGPMQVCNGKAATKAKGVWWFENHEVHGFAAHGPYVNGDQFAIRYEMDITNKPSGTRTKSDEVALYTVKNGKIVEERFFY
jgi:hypothetical protein